MNTAERIERLHRITSIRAMPDPFGAGGEQQDLKGASEPVVADVVTASVTSVSPVCASEPVSKTGMFHLIELILKRRDQLDVLIRESSLQPQLMPRFLAIALLGFVFFGLALSLVFTTSGQWPRLVAIRDLLTGEVGSVVAFESLPSFPTRLSPWLDGSAAALVAAYAVGLVAATGICLPSLYFYSLLAGIRLTMSDVVIQSLKAKATAAVALIGILPIYAALGLGVVIFELPAALRDSIFWLGLSLPFLAGLFGTYSLYQGLVGFADTLAADRRCRRTCLLRRLVASWSACYTAVTPVMIHTLWVLFAGP
jgi:hypothetical protein